MERESLVEKSAVELRELLFTLKRELFNLRVQKATGQVGAMHRFRQLRKEIARVYTSLVVREGKGKCS